MSKFVTEQTIPIRVDGDPNTIYIRSKLNFGQNNQIRSVMATGQGSELINTMMEVYIQSWSGPDFEKVKCTPDKIRALDPDDPLVEAVGDKIAELVAASVKQEEESPDPNLPDASGPINAG